MNTVVVVAALAALVVSTLAQVNVDECVLDPTQFVWSQNFARRSGVCDSGYHCSNGQVVEPGIACPAGLYFSVSLGVCVPPNAFYMSFYFGANTCEQEAQRYNAALRTRRENVCAAFRATYGNERNQTRLYAGDPQDCKQYFSCQVGAGKDWLHICPGGTYFDNTQGDCSLLAPDASRCAS